MTGWGNACENFLEMWLGLSQQTQAWAQTLSLAAVWPWARYSNPSSWSEWKCLLCCELQRMKGMSNHPPGGCFAIALSPSSLAESRERFHDDNDRRFCCPSIPSANSSLAVELCGWWKLTCQLLSRWVLGTASKCLPQQRASHLKKGSHKVMFSNSVSLEVINQVKRDLMKTENCVKQKFLLRRVMAGIWNVPWGLTVETKYHAGGGGDSAGEVVTEGLWLRLDIALALLVALSSFW